MVLKKYESYILSNIDKVKIKSIKESTIQNPNLSIVMPGGCNGKCDFCFWKKSKPCDNYLEKLNNVLYSLPDQFYQLSITGGEPTLSPYLESTLNIIDRNIFTHTVLTSNGCKLLDFVPKLEGKIDHVNISRHHFDDDINDSIFKSKMLTNEELKNVTDELNKVGIDVTFSAVLSEKLNTQDDINNYIKFAKDCGASQVFFRKPHGTLDPTDVEKTYEGYKSNEYSCPVCRTKVQKISGINVSWKASLEEPSKELGTIYELVINENAEVTKDWEGKMKVDYTNISENYVSVFESCGGEVSSGCNGSSEDNSSKSCNGGEIGGCVTKKKKKKKSKTCGGGDVGGCASESLVTENCGGGYGGCGSLSAPSGPPYYLYYGKSYNQAITKITVNTKSELKELLTKFDLTEVTDEVYKMKKAQILDIIDFLDLLRDSGKYNI